MTAGFSEAAAIGAFLVVYHETDSQVRELRPGTPKVVGRSPHADVSVAAASVSREHARFSLRDDALLVEDLGSRNGVIFEGKSVERALMQPGQHVRLGSVTVWFHRHGGPSGHGSAVLERYDELRTRTQLELDRARAEKYCLSVVVIRSGDVAQAPISRYWPSIHQRLGPADAMTLYSPDAVLATIAAKSTAEARRAVDRLMAAGTPLLCGAAEFPHCAQSFEALVSEANAAAHRATRAERVVFAEPAAAGVAPASDRLVARSPALLAVLQQVRRLSAVDVPVLVHGESGTGKELIAQALHAGGPRARGPLCAINCAALPGELVESVLFGHVRGAFTGADRATAGLFVQASSGTLLLDEVAELSASAQAALLRVLETKLVRPIGAKSEIAVDVRVVSATNADLEARAAEGRFRLDLLYRIAAITVHLPPLRERPEDTEALAELFVEQACERWGRGVPELAPELRAALRAYAWPGNARELRNVVERALVISDAPSLALEHLPERVRSAVAREQAPGSPTGFGPAPASEGTQPDAPASAAVAAYEAALIRKALHDADGNRTRAAAQLKMPLRTFMRKLKKLGVVSNTRGE